MAALPRVTFFHAPNSRSGDTRALLEELGAPYDMKVLNLKKGEQRDAKYLAVNPMGKVPAIVHDGQLITEQGAVFTYLADLYPQAGLAPAIGDPLRGPYLRWMFFYGSCFEPAVVDRSQKTTPAPASTCPYGDFDTMLKTVNDQLKKGPWMLGEKFTALDVLYGGALRWTVGFKLISPTPEIQAYIDRVAARPAIQRASAADMELAASQPS